MTEGPRRDSFRAAAGRRVVSRSSAEELGSLGHLVVDVGRRQVTALVLGSGRRAHLVDWAQVTGFGPDAVMVTDDTAVREPADDLEEAAAGGKLDLLGRRALSELGVELGTVDDVVFDPASGALERLVVGQREHPAGVLLGAGSYAAVLDRSTQEDHGPVAPG